MKFQSQYKYPLWRKRIWKCQLQNGAYYWGLFILFWIMYITHVEYMPHNNIFHALQPNQNFKYIVSTDVIPNITSALVNIFARFHILTYWNIFVCTTLCMSYRENIIIIAHCYRQGCPMCWSSYFLRPVFCWCPLWNTDHKNWCTWHQIWMECSFVLTKIIS